RPSKAILADSSLPQASCRWTHQAGVVQGLNDGDAFFLANVIRAWRNQGKRIVKMGDIWPFSASQRPQFSCAIESPDCLKASSDLAEECAVHNLVIVACIFQNLVACGAQQFFLAAKDFVFSTRPAVAIVCQQYFHENSRFSA